MIKVRVKNRIITCKKELVEDNVDTFSLVFDFDSMWEGYTKRITFFNDGIEEHSSNPIEIPLEDSCIIPWEVLQSPGNLYLSIKGTKQGTNEVILTQLMNNPIKVNIAGLSGGVVPAAPTPDMVTLIMNTAQEAKDIAQSVKDDADAGKFIGPPGPKGDKGEKGDKGLPGTTVYSELTDKPIINGVTLEGDKSLSDLGIPTKISELTDDSDFVKKDEYASASQAGIIRTPVGCGISVDKDGSAHVDFPLREITSKTDDIRVTHGSGIYLLEFNSGKYAKLQDIYAKQDKLSAEQLNNIAAVPNKIDKSEIGDGLKFADGKLQLDIPIATANTTYGGGA